MDKSNVQSTGMGQGPPPAVFHRNGSSDGEEHHLSHPSNMKSAPPPYQRGYSYPPHYPASRPPHHIQSVVTTSFSMDEEREDGSSRHAGPPSGANFPHPEYRSTVDRRHLDSREGPRHGRSPPHGREEKHPAFEPPHHGRDAPHYNREIPPVREAPHYSRELPPVHEGELDRRPPPHDAMRSSRPVRVPPSPRGVPGDHPPPIHRSHSAGGPLPASYRGQGPLKRSFWHHARSGDDYPGSLPNEFMPPKRSKISSSMRRDYVVTARTHPDDIYPSERGPTNRPPPGWFNRAMSWEAREEYYRREPGSKMYPEPWSRSPSYREGGNGPHWSEAPNMPSSRSRYSEGGHFEGGHSWNQSRWHHPEDHPWGGPQHRDEAESKHMGPEAQEREGYDGEVRRQTTFESGSDGEPPMRFIGGPQMSRDMDVSAPASTPRGLAAKPPTGVFSGDATSDRKNGPVRLLALPEDRISLSETLCIVREVSSYIDTASSISQSKFLSNPVVCTLNRMLKCLQLRWRMWKHQHLAGSMLLLSDRSD
jgi:hypothetical protein